MNPAEQFEIKDSITVEGIFADHVWYNANLLTQKMGSWATDFQKLVSIMDARHKEHLKIIDDLLVAQSVLKREIALLKSAAKE
jgi:hypothetical protein